MSSAANGSRFVPGRASEGSESKTKLASKTSRSELGGLASAPNAGAAAKDSKFASSHASEGSRFDASKMSRSEMGGTCS